MGQSAFVFNDEDEASTLIMRSTRVTQESPNRLAEAHLSHDC